VNPFTDFFATPQPLEAHAPVLMVVGPLVAACAAGLSPNGRWAWVISVGGAVFAAWMALALAGSVAREGVVTYALGGFAPPMGIAFRIDALGSMFALLVSVMGVMAALVSGHSLNAEIRTDKHTLVQAGFLLCLSGLLGITATGDAFNAFVFLEISSIASYALIATGAARDRRALPAAFNSLVMGTIGATFFVLGIGFLYAATGTLNMEDMAARLATLETSRAAQAGFALVVAGLGLKAAMFPLHLWLPGAYAHAPTAAAIFLSATATKAAIYLLARFVFGVFGTDMAFTETFLIWVAAPLATAAAIICSAQAIHQTELRRILAYSSVAQTGYVLLGLATGRIAGLSAGFFHLFNHALMIAALFMAVGGLARRGSGRTLSDFAGAGLSAPWTMAAFGIATLSLAGAPLTAGLLSKWMLVEAMIARGWIWAVVAIAIVSLLTIIYAWRMLEAVFFRARPEGADAVREAPPGVLVPLWALAIANVWFGIDASLPVGLAEAGARAVTGAPP